jgi:hypothetical protein
LLFLSSRAVATALLFVGVAFGQSPGSAGTVEGTVTDPSGASIAGASVTIGNPISGFKRTTAADAGGLFRFRNVPPNQYRVAVKAPGFEDGAQDVSVRSAVPITLNLSLTLAGERTSVTVDGGEGSIVENVPYAHNDIDREAFAKLPITSPGSALSDTITMSAPGVVADSNGFFHPLGDHAQTSYAVDGQPIGDQQNKQFSTQIPVNAIQSMELITGAPSAEFGDKTSLVVNAQTRTGIGQKPFGSYSAQYGSFGTVGEEASFGLGNSRLGNFLVANSQRSGRFLDTPEFLPRHDVGNSETIFDHLDWHPTDKDAVHINWLLARNWFQVPNNYDQPAQDQRQRVLTYNLAPGYQRTFKSSLLFNVNAFLRRDQVNYYPSRDVMDDTPATVSQLRYLTNYGVKSDIGYAGGVHNLKAGVQFMRTALSEHFTLGITDPSYNALCVNSAGDPQALPTVGSTAACEALGFVANPDLQPGLVPFDLTRGGSLFRFAGRTNIDQAAFYVQDAITLGRLSINGGLRIDVYRGLTNSTGVSPRTGVSYMVKSTGTVLRAAFSRTFETPYNENLVLSSSTGSGGLAANVFGAAGVQPIEPGHRNQFNTGFQQSVNKYLQIDADYFWKFTKNAFDFGTLLDSPIVFPISWRKSKIDGFSMRLSTANIHGFQAFTTLGHTRARYFGPSTGGLIFNSALSDGVFRIDHDQALAQTTNARYQRGKDGAWIAFTWRYDSGMVAGAVSSLDDALALTAAQQAAIGFYCGGQQASLGHPITACASSNYGASRLRIPAAGTANDDHNPARLAPRHIFDVAVGTDNLLHAEHYRTTLKLTVSNLTNQASLYNFLSTFSGTHFVTPRAYQAEIGFVF